MPIFLFEVGFKKKEKLIQLSNFVINNKLHFYIFLHVFKILIILPNSHLTKFDELHFFKCKLTHI